VLPHTRSEDDPGRERAAQVAFASIAACSTLILVAVVGYVFWRAWPAFKANGLSYVTNDSHPGFTRELQFASSGGAYRQLHAWPTIYGTLLTTGGAILIGLPFSLFASIFLAELAPRRLARLIEPLVRIMAAVPSVVWGLFGLLVLAPRIQGAFISDELAAKYQHVVPIAGTNVLLGIFVLTLMTVPFQIAIFADALRAVPPAWREGGRALGLDGWRMTMKISLPVVRPAIATGVVLATGRAVGEAIALSMVTGSNAYVPNPLDGFVFFLEPTRPLAALFVDYSEGIDQPAIAADLFSFAALILISALALMLAVRAVSAPIRARSVL
jgi:phosphate transport system permease protein